MSITPSNNFLSAALPFCPEPEANSWVNHTYQSPFSDFSIYSSDGHEFKVYKYQLMAASQVFRSMLSACDQNTLCSNNGSEVTEMQLTDDEIERCHSIRLFLDLICGRPIDPPSSSFRKYLNVGLLLKKYDCEGHMQSWKWALRAWSTDYVACTMTTFVCAANLDEIGTMVNLIATRSSTWAKKSHRDADDNIHQADGARGPLNKVLETAVTGNLVLDLTSARQDFFEAIPLVYSLALLRASRSASESGILDKKSRLKVSQEFERIVKAGPQNGTRVPDGADKRES